MILYFLIGIYVLALVVWSLEPWRPLFRVVVYPKGKGVDIFIERKRYSTFPDEARDHDGSQGPFNNVTKRIRYGYVTVANEERLGPVISDAKALCAKWNNGDDDAQRLYRTARKLLK